MYTPFMWFYCLYSHILELKFEVHLVRSNKGFSKKPIIQVAGIPEFHLIISLSDSIISVHDLDKVVSPLIATIQKTKGASLFVLDVQNCETLTGNIVFATLFKDLCTSFNLI